MPKTLLVADDSVVIQKSIGITFAQEDYAITFVGNGEEAYQKAREMKPDVILADVVMPKKNGYELCQLLRNDPQLNQVPVLLLAGAQEPYDETKGQAVGATGHIIKPFESQALIAKVNEMATTPVAPPAPQPAAAPPPPAPAPQAAAPAPPPAATPPTPTTPSPASTIMGQAPQVQPAAAPQPPAQPPAQPAASPPPPAPQAAAPVETPQAAAPDLPPPPAPASPADSPAGPNVDFDFSDFGSGDTTPEPAADPTPDAGTPFEANTGDPPMAEPIGTPPSEAAPSEPLPAGDFWDFSEDSATAETTAPEQKAATPESAPAEQWQVTSGAPLGEPAVQPEPAPDPAIAPAPEVPEEGGFDLGAEISADPSAQPAFGGAAGLDRGGLEMSEPVSPVEFATSASEEITAPLPGAESAGAVPASVENISEAQLEQIVSKVFHKVIERIAWEVVPDMAETIIKEELSRLTRDKQ